jgi:hypothetical protein
MKGKFDWTADAIARLHQLVEQKLTAAEIAAQLGPGVLTRNAVIGKTHREKIKLQTPPNGVVGREHRARERSRPVVDTPISAFRRLAPVRHDRGVPYLQLERWHCKALLDGRGRDGLPLCCGRLRWRDTPYCSDHLQLYTTHAYAPRHRRAE